MNETNNLVQAIRAAPSDDSIRLVYADWLEEHDQTAQAAFIRTQIELSRLLPCDHPVPLAACQRCDLLQREQEWLRVQGPTWIAEHFGAEWSLLESTDWIRTPSPGLSCGVAFQRGLVTFVYLPLDAFETRGVELYRQHAVQHIQLHGKWPARDGLHWGWSDECRLMGSPSAIPRSLHRCLEVELVPESNWATAEDALEGLSRACLERVRREASILELSADDQGDALTTGEVARILHVPRAMVNRWVDAGILQGYRRPGSQERRVPKQSLIWFLKDHKAMPKFQEESHVD